MKFAVTGKGGVGKTTLTSLLAYSFVDLGYQVLAIDADPSPCLGAALGFPEELLKNLTPIASGNDMTEVEIIQIKGITAKNAPVTSTR